MKGAIMRLFTIVVISLVLSVDHVAAQAVTGINVAAVLEFRDLDPHPALLSEYKNLSATNRIQFLVSQIRTNVEPSDSDGNWRKATAMHLLGRSSAANRIDIIFDNMTFVDTRHHTFPAYYALREMGESIVSNVLEFAITNRDYKAVDCAGEVLHSVLGQEKYRELLKKNKGRIPYLVYQVLSARDAE